MMENLNRLNIIKNLSVYDNLVGFDLDGTLNDLDAYQKKCAQKFFRERPVNADAYDIEDMFECSHFIRQVFWARYIWYYCLRYTSRQDAKEVIQRVRNLSLKPCLITARVYATNKGILGALFRSMVHYWDKNQELNIGANNTIFCSEKNSAIEKAKICNKLNIRWMFEDKPDNVLKISQTTKTHVLCPKTPYNKMIRTGQNITVIDSLVEGIEIIEEALNKGEYKYVK